MSELTTQEQIATNKAEIAKLEAESHGYLAMAGQSKSAGPDAFVSVMDSLMPRWDQVDTEICRLKQETRTLEAKEGD